MQISEEIFSQENLTLKDILISCINDYYKEYSSNYVNTKISLKKESTNDIIEVTNKIVLPFGKENRNA